MVGPHKTVIIDELHIKSVILTLNL